MGQDSTGNAHDLEAEVRSKGWTTDELMEHSFIGPEEEGTTEVLLNPEVEEQGGEIRDLYGEEHLVWEYREATIAVTNRGFGNWRAEIAFPPDVAKWINGPGGIEHTVKSSFYIGLGDQPEGYIEEVWQENDATRGALGENVPPTRMVVRTSTNFQPTVVLQSLVDDLWEYAEGAQQTAETTEAAFKAAKENKPLVGEDEFPCPECGKGIAHVMRKGGEGPLRCPKCEADIEDQINVTTPDES